MTDALLDAHERLLAVCNADRFSFERYAAARAGLAFVRLCVYVSGAGGVGYSAPTKNAAREICEYLEAQR